MILFEPQIQIYILQGQAIRKVGKIDQSLKYLKKILIVAFCRSSNLHCRTLFKKTPIYNDRPSISLFCLFRTANQLQDRELMWEGMKVGLRGFGKEQVRNRSLDVEIYGGVVQQFTLVKMYGQEREIMENEEQIMIMLDGLEENEEGQDLLEQLVAEPKTSKKSSLNYDYQPAPISSQDIEETETTELKTSNRSTSTCADSEAPTRRCFCTKTRCQKNYCQCFKLGLACTPDCECLACGNKEPLFIGRATYLVIKCKCQKSHCLKKYCQCHSSGRRCGPACKCLECENLEQKMEEEKPEQGDYIDHFLFFNI